MGVLGSSYIKTMGVKWPGHKKIFCVLSDTLMLISIVITCLMQSFVVRHYASHAFLIAAMSSVQSTLWILLYIQSTLKRCQTSCILRFNFKKQKLSLTQYWRKYWNYCFWSILSTYAVHRGKYNSSQYLRPSVKIISAHGPLISYFCTNDPRRGGSICLSL